MSEVKADSADLEAVTRRLLARLGNLRPAMSGIGVELENRIRNRIDTRTDPNGAAWVGWADSTIKTYPKDGNRQLLDRYGDMIRSLGYQADTLSVAVGFGQSYATYHEFGTERMPRRGLLTADPEQGTLADADEQAILDILYDLLDTTLSAS